MLNKYFFTLKKVAMVVAFCAVLTQVLCAQVINPCIEKYVHKNYSGTGNAYIYLDTCQHILIEQDDGLYHFNRYKEKGYTLLLIEDTTLYNPIVSFKETYIPKQPYFSIRLNYQTKSVSLYNKVDETSKSLFLYINADTAYKFISNMDTLKYDKRIRELKLKGYMYNEKQYYIKNTTTNDIIIDVKHPSDYDVLYYMQLLSCPSVVYNNYNNQPKIVKQDNKIKIWRGKTSNSYMLFERVYD